MLACLCLLWSFSHCPAVPQLEALAAVSSMLMIISIIFIFIRSLCYLFFQFILLKYSLFTMLC